MINFKNLFSFFIIRQDYKKKFIFRFLGIKITFKTKIKYNYSKIYKHFKDIECRLKTKEKINVVFMVSLKSMFPAKPFCDYLLKQQNSKFNVKILITPDFRFGFDNALKLQNEFYEILSKEYDTNILIKANLDEDKDDVNLEEIADILFYSIPYNVSHLKYHIENILDKDILPAMINYGFYRSYYDRKTISEPSYSMYWKVFAETKYNMEEYKNFSLNKGKNCILTGYCKMDSFIPKTNNKTTIMISPHHSVTNGYNDTLNLSNFYNYSDFFLKLPEIYPNIDFIFRPHPVLFLLLAKDEFWGKQKTENYINKMKSYDNVEYSTKENYFEDFANSNGLINDCGSYLVEYFYTKKPQCYMLKSPDDIKEKFVELGQKCLENCYIAYNKEQILHFIDEVILNEKDFKKEQRENFSKKEIMINYPNVSEKIYDEFERIFSK